MPRRVLTREKIEAAIAIYGNELFTYASGLTRNRVLAQDLVHGVYGRIFSNPPILRREKSMKSYLLTCVQNAFKDHLKLPRNNLTSRFGFLRDDDLDRWLYPNNLPDYSPEEKRDVKEDKERRKYILRRAMGSMTPLQREVFTYRVLEEFTTKQTAEAMGSNSGAIKMELHRAYDSLRVGLKKQGVVWEGKAPTLFGKNFPKKHSRSRAA